MRLIIVTQTFPPRIGGMEAVMEGISIGLSKQFPIKIFPNFSVSKSYIPKDLLIDIHYFPAPKFLKAYFKKLFLYFYADEKDIFLCDSWKSVNAIPKKFKDNIHILGHGQEYLNHNKRKRIVNALKRASSIIANSNYTKKLIKNFVSNKSIHVIPPTYMLPENVSKKRNQKKIFNFFSVARIEQRKGFLESLMALHEIKSENSELNFHWHIAGDGPQINLLKKFVKDNQMTPFITFYGYVDNKMKDNLFSQSDLFLMPSYHIERSVEGFGIVYAEAARYGLASLAGADGGASDVVKDKISGWCVDVKKQGELKKILLFALKNKALLLKMGNEAQKIYSNNFAGKVALEKLSKVLKKIN